MNTCAAVFIVMQRSGTISHFNSVMYSLAFQALSKAKGVKWITLKVS